MSIFHVKCQLVKTSCLGHSFLPDKKIDVDPLEEVAFDLIGPC